MIRKLFLFHALWVFFGLSVGADPAWSRRLGITNEDVIQLPPSFLTSGDLNTHETRILCYELFTGKALDCHFILYVAGVLDHVARFLKSCVGKNEWIVISR